MIPVKGKHLVFSLLSVSTVCFCIGFYYGGQKKHQVSRVLDDSVFRPCVTDEDYTRLWQYQVFWLVHGCYCIELEKKTGSIYQLSSLGRLSPGQTVLFMALESLNELASKKGMPFYYEHAAGNETRIKNLQEEIIKGMTIFNEYRSETMSTWPENCFQELQKVTTSPSHR